jgi:methyl-accepting chemotaxis protein
MVTPEQQWIQINNAIQALMDVQGKHDERIEKITTSVDKISVQTEKNAAAIRDLVVVSRTLLDSHIQIDAELKRLVGTVDRLGDMIAAFVKSLQKPNGQN